MTSTLATMSPDAVQPSTQSLAANGLGVAQPSTQRLAAIVDAVTYRRRLHRHLGCALRFHLAIRPAGGHAVAMWYTDYHAESLASVPLILEVSEEYHPKILTQLEVANSVQRSNGLYARLSSNGCIVCLRSHNHLGPYTSESLTRKRVFLTRKSSYSAYLDARCAGGGYWRPPGAFVEGSNMTLAQLDKMSYQEIMALWLPELTLESVGPLSHTMTRRAMDTSIDFSEDSGRTEEYTGSEDLSAPQPDSTTPVLPNESALSTDSSSPVKPKTSLPWSFQLDGGQPLLLLAHGLVELEMVLTPDRIIAASELLQHRGELQLQDVYVLGRLFTPQITGTFQRVRITGPEVGGLRCTFTLSVEEIWELCHEIVERLANN